jgi:hypothetical protein
MELTNNCRKDVFVVTLIIFYETTIAGTVPMMSRERVCPCSH